MARVLILDNSAFFRRLLAEMVREAGHEATVFASGVEALLEACERPPDAVVADLFMPGLDGLGFCQALTGRLGDSAPPVVLISGAHQIPVAEVLEQSGAAAMLAKSPPATFGPELKRLLDRLLSGQKLGRRRIYGAQGLHKREITAELLDIVAQRDRWLAQIDEGLLEFGDQLTLVFLNRAARLLLDLGEDPVIGMPLAELLASRTLASGQVIGRLLAAHDGPPCRARLRTRGRQLLATCTHVGSGDTASGFITLKDHTSVVRLNERLRRYSKNLEQKIAERTHQVRQAYDTLKETQKHMVLAEKLSMLGVLSAGIAHEINNPLAFLEVNLGFLQERLTEYDGRARLGEENRAELLESIAESRAGVERMSAIIQDLRQLARTEPTSSEAIELADPIAFALRMATKTVQRVARLEVELADDLPAVVGDERAFRQVFLALLINAADAFEGRRDADNRVVLRATASDGSVRVEVQDNGGGISDEVLPHVFDPYFTTRESRAGLGLPTSVSILRQHHATLTIEQTSGEGTTVVAQFPTRPPAARGAGSDVELLAARPRVLFVDDEEPLLNSIERYFRGRWRVMLASSGAEALKGLDEDPEIDAIVCDLLMPEMDGAEFARRACGINPALRRRIIFLTGGDLTSEGPEEALTQFDNLVLHKPIRLDYLAELIEEVIWTANEQAADEIPSQGEGSRQ